LLVDASPGCAAIQGPAEDEGQAERTNNYQDHRSGAGRRRSGSMSALESTAVALAPVVLASSQDYTCELDLQPAARPQDGYIWTVRTHWAGARDPQSAQVRQQMTVNREALLALQAHLDRLLGATP
jgi:hypothetical protein